MLCLFVLIGSIALHFPEIHANFAWPIVVVLSMVSFATPISGMFFLSASQVIPDPVMHPIVTPSMMAIGGFFLWQLPRVFRFVAIRNMLLIKIAAPFFIWCSIMTMVRGNYPYVLLTTYSIITGFAATIIARQSKGRPLSCLVAFLAGQAIAATVFWIVKLGLGQPVQTFDTEIFGGSFADSLRFGCARGNATSLGPSMGIVAVGVISHWLLVARNRSFQNWVARIAGLLLLLVVVPPLIASGCRGAMVAVVGGLLFLVVAGLVSVRTLYLASPVIIAGGLILGTAWNQLNLDKAWSFTIERQSHDNMYGGSLISGRQNEWGAAAMGVLDSPIIGGGKIIMRSYQDNPEMWASHCSYLDSGLAGGIPGMILFCFFVIYPIKRLWRGRHDPVVACFLAMYVMNAIVIATTSAGYVKTLWILWGIGVVLMERIAVTPPAQSRLLRLIRVNLTKHVGPVAIAVPHSATCNK